VLSRASTESIASTSASRGAKGSAPSASTRVNVHEARVQVADLLLERARLSGLRLLDDLAHGLLGLFGENHERAVARLVGRNRRAGNPAAVHVPVEVVVGANVGVEFCAVDAAGKHVSHAGEPNRPA
jgi:hypothetical protein